MDSIRNDTSATAAAPDLRARLRQWVKAQQHPAARTLFRIARQLRAFELPAPRPLFRVVYALYQAVTGAMSALLRIVWWTPLFKSQLEQVGQRVYLYGGLPYLAGPLNVRIGNDCRISGRSTITGRGVRGQAATLRIGDNVDIGWMNTIAVGDLISIGNNTRLAGQCFLAGYSGHPQDPIDRAAGLPEPDARVGSIILEDDVWLATGVTVVSGVRIGRGTIVAAGSVVTRDLPVMVLAAGNPAKVIRALGTDDRAPAV